MKYPIIVYGSPVLRQKAIDIQAKDCPRLKELIQDMFETMYGAGGVGLAAPQVGVSVRLFVIDGSVAGDKVPELKNFKRVFINAAMLEETGEEWKFNEGCLSIPHIMEEVSRKPVITLSYYDENWKLHEEIFTGFAARIIQHEYDHIEGKLFVDKLDLERRSLIETKLLDITKGLVDVKYQVTSINQ
jgi:peptide deformylase